MFDVLGLDAMEEGVYRRLLQVPSAAARSLAVWLPAKESEISDALKSLEEKGLVARSTASPSHFVASPPDLGLGSLVVSRQEDIRRVQLELARLTDQYRSTNSGRTDTDVVDVVRGRQAVAQRFAQLQRGAKQEVLALVKSTPALVTAEENVDEDKAIARGVIYRVVHERAAFEQPGFLDLVVESLQAGELVRVVPEVPLRLVIADRALALVPLVSAFDGASGALLVHKSGLLDALVTLFDLVWFQAFEVVPSTAGIREMASDQIDETDARVLTLLLAGLTDQTIGGQLGMSLRTVQRRVSHLMDQAGVVTRFQLGHEAARRGWLGI